MVRRGSVCSPTWLNPGTRKRFHVYCQRICWTNSFTQPVVSRTDRRYVCQLSHSGGIASERTADVPLFGTPQRACQGSAGVSVKGLCRESASESHSQKTTRRTGLRR